MSSATVIASRPPCIRSVITRNRPAWSRSIGPCQQRARRIAHDVAGSTDGCGQWNYRPRLSFQSHEGGGAFTRFATQGSVWFFLAAAMAPKIAPPYEESITAPIILTGFASKTNATNQRTHRSITTITVRVPKLTSTVTPTPPPNRRLTPYASQ